jgi:hypothetical protein
MHGTRSSAMIGGRAKFRNQKRFAERRAQLKPEELRLPRRYSTRRSGAGVGEVGGRHGNGDGELGGREAEAAVLAQLRPRVPRLGPLVEERAQRLVLLLGGGYEVAAEEREGLPLGLRQRRDGALV